MSDDAPGIFFGLVVGIIMGVTLALSMSMSHYQKTAIEHGCAQHNSTTGDFEWKEHGK